MSSNKEGRGKILDFGTFKKQGVIKEVKAQEGRTLEESTVRQSIDESYTRKHELNADDVRVFSMLEKQGIPIIEAFDREERLVTICENAGDFNPKHFQTWLKDLYTEDLKTLTTKVLSLNEQKVQTHPTYARAVFKAF